MPTPANGQGRYLLISTSYFLIILSPLLSKLILLEAQGTVELKWARIELLLIFGAEAFNGEVADGYAVGFPCDALDAG